MGCFGLAIITVTRNHRLNNKKKKEIIVIKDENGN